MRRRRVLATFAAGISTTTAGCGYAYGGGAVRSSASIPQPDQTDEGYLFTKAGETFVTAQIGRMWIRDENGDPQYITGTRVRQASKLGETIWAFTHFEPVRDLAFGDRAFLLEEENRVVASVPSEVRKEETSSFNPESEIAWTTVIPDASGPIEAIGETVVVPGDRTLTGLREGESHWELGLPSMVRTISRSGDTLLVGTGETTVCVRSDGTICWEYPTNRGPAITIHGEHTLLRDRTTLTLLDLESGEPHWEESLDQFGDIGLTTQRMYARTGQEITAYERDSGERLWSVEAPLNRGPLIVPSNSGVYAASAGGAVVAVDSDGIRWRRHLDLDQQSVPLASWLEEETVAVCFDTGEIRQLQRQAQDRPILW